MRRDSREKFSAHEPKKSTLAKHRYDVEAVHRRLVGILQPAPVDALTANS
jgi:hypothetical protein